MMNKALLGAAVAVSALSAATPALATVYVVNRTIGGASVIGTITTDSTIGVIREGNITDFSLTFDGSAGPLTANKATGTTIVVGSALVASATEMTFDYSSSENGLILGMNDFSAFLCSVSVDISCTGGDKGVTQIIYNNAAFIQPLTGVQAFATVATAAVPEPATWGMMIAGFGVMGAALRTRRRTMKVAFG
ncbi:PEPxxWA-CTERM sorting domain-containing protein [Sphingomonas aliaeris]|nr:PEPxxWA-CTERM sorting domain-containing protein [Sphingomonas aliaeris]